MKVIEHIRTAKKPLFSIEILPPLKGMSIDSIYDAIDPLLDFDIKFIDVTYHREEYVWRKKPDGTEEKVAIRKRPGTVGISAAILNKYKIDTVPHLICGGFSKEETENALIELTFHGIDNVLAIRGDKIKSEHRWTPQPDGHHHAIDLVKQVVSMNKGAYLDGDLMDATPTNFCIGVAAYPEVHFEAKTLEADMEFLKQKIAAGADYIVTQMFFDNAKFFSFVDKCRAMGIMVPIIPGLKVLTTKRQVKGLPEIFSIDLPEEFLNELEKCTTDKEVKEVGIEWCINQSKELYRSNVPVLHFYTMGTSDSTKRVVEKVF